MINVNERFDFAVPLDESLLFFSKPNKIGMFQNDEFEMAINRIYYGIYYILSALALANRFSTSKHSQLIGWFNKTFVKSGIIDARYSKWIRKAFENRMESDYNVMSDFSREEVEQSFDEMQKVIVRIQELL